MCVCEGVCVCACKRASVRVRARACVWWCVFVCERDAVCHCACECVCVWSGVRWCVTVRRCVVGTLALPKQADACLADLQVPCTINEHANVGWPAKCSAWGQLHVGTLRSL